MPSLDTPPATPRRIPASMPSDRKIMLDSLPSSGSLGGASNKRIPEKSSGKARPRASRIHTLFLKLQRRIPILKRFAEVVYRIPPRARWALVVLWIAWKVFLVLVFLWMLLLSQQQSPFATIVGSTNQGAQVTRVLYIVTTLAEFNNGLRATVKGQDRLGELVVPLLVDNIENMIGYSSGERRFHVDLYLILGYELRPERDQLLRSRLPQSVGLEIWDDASPLGYEPRKDPHKIRQNTRALARQHRYVIKDKYDHYDLFLAFEDDMRLTGHHLDHFLAMTNAIDRLRLRAPDALPDVPEPWDDPLQLKFFGPMTRKQMDRLVPGFIRVEVLLNETEYGAQQQVDPIPLDYQYDKSTANLVESHVDPSICCHVHLEPNPSKTPSHPPVDDVIIWETNAKAFTLRQLPVHSANGEFDWTVVMLGPGKRLDPGQRIGGYWTGRDGNVFGKDRPTGGPPDLIAQQGGWMATKAQLARLHTTGLCMGSFLPPFNKPDYHEDGQQSMNVEFWSGSYQFFTGVKSGCNMQRLISMHPDHFSKHLIYHVANNKQRQLSQDRMLRADHLYGQLNTVRKRAIQEKAQLSSV